MATWSKEVFARNLKKYMVLSGKNQKELAKIVGVSAPTMNDWIQAKKFPRIDKIDMLADYFGILKSDLIEDKTEKPTEYDGLSEKKQALMQFAMSVPDDKAEMILRVMRSIVESD